jgi:hypothetical protein
VKGDPVEIVAVEPEGVEVACALAAPVDELDTGLERPFGHAKELVLVDVEHPVEVDDRRDRRLADADGADGIGLDQGDPPPAVVEEAREGGRGHPSGGAAADDHHPADFGIATAKLRRPAPIHPQPSEKIAAKAWRSLAKAGHTAYSTQLKKQKPAANW